MPSQDARSRWARATPCHGRLLSRLMRNGSSVRLRDVCSDSATRVPDRSLYCSGEESRDARVQGYYPDDSTVSAEDGYRHPGLPIIGNAARLVLRVAPIVNEFLHKV